MNEGLTNGSVCNHDYVHEMALVMYLEMVCITIFMFSITRSINEHSHDIVRLIALSKGFIPVCLRKHK